MPREGTATSVVGGRRDEPTAQALVRTRRAKIWESLMKGGDLVVGHYGHAMRSNSCASRMRCAIGIASGHAFAHGALQRAQASAFFSSAA